MLSAMFVLEILVIVGAPVGLWIVLSGGQRERWELVGIGALSFVISQLLQLPVNQALGLAQGGGLTEDWSILPVAALSGLTTGILVEGTRYVILRFWRTEARSWKQGVAFGAGHGGTQIVLVGLLVLVSFVSMALLRTTDLEELGMPEEMLEDAEREREAFWATPWYVPLLGVVERLSVFVLQTSFALLVLRSITGGSFGWLAGAIGGHAVMDGGAVYLGSIGWPLWAIEVLLLLYALAGLTFILRSREQGTFEK